jgi:hypothetical protein
VPVPCSDVWVRLGETVIRGAGCNGKRGPDVEHTTFLIWEACEVFLCGLRENRSGPPPA